MTLNSYIPIIQLLAGSIYVVYFFDQRMKDPFKEKHAKLKREYNKFFFRYQPALSKKAAQHLQRLKKHNEKMHYFHFYFAWES